MGRPPPRDTCGPRVKWRPGSACARRASQPFVAGHGRGDPQRQALLAEQRVAAVTGAKRPDLTCLREMNDVLGRAARPRHILSPRRQRLADRVHAGDKGAVGAKASTTARPMRVMMRILTTTYGLSEISTPIWLMCDAQAAPSKMGSRTSSGPACSPQKALSACRASRRADPVVRRAGVHFCFAADERAVFDARDVLGSESAR